MRRGKWRYIITMKKETTLSILYYSALKTIATTVVHKVYLVLGGLSCTMVACSRRPDRGDGSKNHEQENSEGGRKGG